MSDTTGVSAAELKRRELFNELVDKGFYGPRLSEEERRNLPFVSLPEGFSKIVYVDEKGNPVPRLPSVKRPKDLSRLKGLFLRRRPI